MKTRVSLLMGCLAVLVLAAAGCMVSPGVKEAVAQAKHPELSEQEMYIPCAECHQEATPELHKEWYESAHGVAMVKCYQCHGTFETFRLSPTRQDCAVCHESNVAKCADGEDCWKKYVPHTFKEKK